MTFNFCNVQNLVGFFGLTFSVVNLFFFLTCIYFWLFWVFITAWVFSSCGKWGLLSSCRAQVFHCSDFSCCRARAVGCACVSGCGSWALEHRAQELWFPGSRAQGSGVVVPRLWSTGLRSCGSQALEHRAQELWFPGSRAQGSVVMAHGLSCSVACGSSWVRDQTLVSCIGRWILVLKF